MTEQILKVLGKLDERNTRSIIIINVVEGLIPLTSDAHCGYTSLHEYVITIDDLNRTDYILV